jgi:phage N-6-adenine-methyltransferase
MSEALPAVANLRGALATPQTTAVRQVMADGIIAVAAKLQDWPLLHEAVDIKIADQREFVAEWDRLFNGRGGDRRQVTERVTSYTEQVGIGKMQVARWRKWLQDAAAYHDKIVLVACRRAGLEPDINRVTPNSGEEQWFTPGQYIAAARSVMGGIDLDPASHPMAQEVVQATQYFTAGTDGLAHEWHGRVWLNPPYTHPSIEHFVTKLAHEFAAGRVTQAILLTNNCTDTGWFHGAVCAAARLCFTRGRINFYGPSGVGEAPLQGQCFCYFGDRLDPFATVFRSFGFICEVLP